MVEPTTDYKNFLTKLLKTEVKPLVEFNYVVRSPIVVSKTYIDKSERIQKHFTKRLNEMWNILFMTGYK